MFTTLISPEQLQQLQQDPAHHVVVFDCSFDLMQPAAGRAQFEQLHLPGARYAHLDEDLSLKGAASGEAASGGRHPLPSRERFARWLGARGVQPATQVVVYDRQSSTFCGRLWWMLKWMGHEPVAVLDGGLQAWQAAGAAVHSGADETPLLPDSVYPTLPAAATLVDATAVAARVGRPGHSVVDARAPARFRGEVEPLDAIAGHIPGALNRPFQSNLQENGRFKPAEVLRAEFDALLAGRDSALVVHHCGSGVTAVPNLIAMEVAGLGRAALYAGSWSDWSSNPARPVARG